MQDVELTSLTSSSSSLPRQPHELSQLIPTNVGSNYCTMQNFVATLLLVLLLEGADIGVLGSHLERSPSTTRRPTKNLHHVHRRHVPDGGLHGKHSGQNTTLFQLYRGGDAGNNGHLFQKIAILLNASSKWLLASVNLYGVIRYRDPGAFLCIGCILACFGTEHILKPLWNQARPLGSSLADPGMPSAHSLGSFFMAIGWAHLLRDLEHDKNDPLPLFLVISTIVASLRIICGYHTIAQVAVGALLGLGLGHGWIDCIWNRLGIKSFLCTHAAVRWIIWSAYITGSVLFIWKIMYKWIDRRMLLH